jgi:hypothetical protein
MCNRFSGRLGTSVLLVLLVAGIAACRSPSQLEGIGTVLLVAEEMARRQFHVAVLNIESRHEVQSWEEYLGRPWAATDEASRLWNLAVKVRQDYSRWSAIGLQELYYQRDRVFTDDLMGYIVPGWHYVELQDLNVGTCGNSERGSYLAADCLASYLHTEVAVQGHANGVIADDELWEPVPWPAREDLEALCRALGDRYAFCGPRDYVLSHIGEKRFTLIYRNVIGVRLRNRLSGIVVPFFSTHLSNTDDADRHREELEDLVAVVRFNYVPGDMPPVIAGDFNCESWSPSTRNIIFADFVEAAGTNGVLGAFVGRPQSFPAAGGVWHVERLPGSVAELNGPIDVRGSLLGEYGGETLYELTDHGMATVTLTAKLDVRPADVTWPHRPGSAPGCWPFD